MSASFARAREFVYRSGRVLEHRVFETLFEDADPGGVVAAVLAYQNEDGGFGHGLEPDKLAPQSQPLDVSMALATLHDAGAPEPEVGRRACDFLDTVADERGFVPMVLPSVLDYPRADHWKEVPTPSVGPAVAIAGYLHALRVEHPWLERVTPNLVDTIRRTPIEDAHEIDHALAFARNAPGADDLLPLLTDALPKARWFRSDAADESYGLPPTKFPRDWFDEEAYGAHLDRLERDQQDDGGWPIAWEPPGPGSVCAWRAIVTIEALRTLETNGRLER